MKGKSVELDHEELDVYVPVSEGVFEYMECFISGQNSIASAVIVI
jgi:hypothetical protein